MPQFVLVFVFFIGRSHPFVRRLSGPVVSTHRGPGQRYLFATLSRRGHLRRSAGVEFHVEGVHLVQDRGRRFWRWWRRGSRGGRGARGGPPSTPRGRRASGRRRGDPNSRRVKRGRTDGQFLRRQSRGRGPSEARRSRTTCRCRGRRGGLAGPRASRATARFARRCDRVPTMAHPLPSTGRQRHRHP